MHPSVIAMPHAQSIRHPDAIRAEPAVHAAAVVYGVTYAEVMSMRRAVPLPQARFAAMLALHRKHWSTPQLARAVGRDDHTTAMHGLKRAIELEQFDQRFARAVRSATKAMGA